MSRMFIYNESWLKETTERLRKQQSQTSDLRKVLRGLREGATVEQRECLNFILTQVERLEQSLITTHTVLTQFLEQMQSAEQEILANYSEARRQSDHIFD